MNLNNRYLAPSGLAVLALLGSSLAFVLDSY